MSSTVESGAVALGGVILGFALNWMAATRTRKQMSAQELERERRQRELLVAERLDEALVRASSALDLGTAPMSDRYAVVRKEWEKAWVSYSPRLRQHKVLSRYEAVGTLLTFIIVHDDLGEALPGYVVARAIANARVTLACFMRGDLELPPPTFPESEELERFLREGNAQHDRGALLRAALRTYPEPDFHAPAGS